MGISLSCCSNDSVQIHECFIESNIEEHYIIDPNPLPSDIGIKRKGQKRSNPSDSVLITSLYKKASSDLSLLLQETSILKKLKHENIIILEGVYEDETVFHEVTEDFEGVTLLDLLQENQTLAETTTRKICKRILRALESMHQQKIYYGNLTMSTVKVLDHKVKLIDFTNARFEDEDFSMSRCNYNFLPPEAFAESYSCASDMWSLGIVLFYLLKGSLPFDGKEKSDIIQRIEECVYSVEGLSTPAKNFIQKLIQKDPLARFSAQNALQSNWMQNILDME